MDQQTQWEQSSQVAEPAQKDKHGLATAGFVLGLVGLVSWLFGILGMAASIVGIILSAMGIKSSKRTYAIVGLVLSILSLIGAIIYTAYSVTHAMQILSSLHLQ